MNEVRWKTLEFTYNAHRDSFFFKKNYILWLIYWYLDHMKRNRLKIYKCYAENANNVYYSIEINELRWKTLEFPYSAHRDSFFFITFYIFWLIYWYLDYMKRICLEISKLYAENANNVYCSIEMNEVQWKTLEFTYTAHRDSFFFISFYIFWLIFWYLDHMKRNRL